MTVEQRDVSSVFRVIWRRKGTIGAIALMAAAAGLYIGFLLPKQYASEGLMLIEAREPLIPELNALGQSSLPPGTLRSRTETDILRSRALLEAVVRERDLASHPEFAPHSAPAPIAMLYSLTDKARGWLQQKFGRDALSAADITVLQDPTKQSVARVVDALQQRLRVWRDEASRVLVVRFEARTPMMAADVVNTIMDRYITDDISARQNLTQQANLWLTNRVTDLKREVEEADRRVQEYRAYDGLLEVESGSLTALQANAVQGQLSVARLELDRLRAALATIRQGGGRLDIATQEVLASPLIQQLREREAESTQRVASLGRRLGDQHPDRQVADVELRNLRRQIDIEITKIAVALERDTQLAEQRVADLERRLDEARAAARSSASASVVLAQLRHEANAKRHVYEAFLARVAQTQFASAQFPSARIISPAVPAQQPSGPPLTAIVAFASFFGGFAAACIVMLRHLLRGSVGSTRELATLTGLPSLAALPSLPNAVLRPGLSQSMTASTGRKHAGLKETLRAMRVNVQAISRDPNGSPVLLVTSSEVGEGKTTLALSFARMSAADGYRVLLVEADLRRPRLAQLMNVQDSRSIEAALGIEGNLNDMVHVEHASGLHFAVADGTSGNAPGLLQSASFAQLIQKARQHYDLIVLDSPPLLRVTDSALLAHLSTVIAFAVRWERTPRTLVTEAIRRLPIDCVERTVTVLTRVSPSLLSSRDSYLGYGSHAPRRRLMGHKALPAPRV
jgi:succinoglycan biosynthesis transport protein ExoP